MDNVLADLNRLFVRSLRALGEAGEIDAACRLAAEGWSVLRHSHPDDAERLNGVLHYLTNPKALEAAARRKARAAETSAAGEA